jgi:ABC-type nitrate/sulfonate/bicarbonate transport system permease component
MNNLPQDLLISMARVLFSTTLSFVLGSGLAYLCYRNRLLHRVLLAPVNFMRHISPFCWLPLIIMLAGIGELSVLLVLTLAMLFNAIIIGIGILQALPRDVMDTASLDGAHGLGMLIHIEIPLAASELIDLYRVLWSVGWTALIAAEMLGVQSGMGYRLMDFRYLLMYKEMLIYILLIGCIGIFTDHLLLALKKKLRY